MNLKIKCNCCLKERKEYITGWCKKCAEKLDNHIKKDTLLH